MIFAVQKLKAEHTERTISEADLFDYILDWKKIWKKDEAKQTGLAETIRSLEILEWVKLQYSDSLPVTA